MSRESCSTYAAGRIEYWENIESDSDEVIEVLLRRRLSAGNWEAAEAWAQDELICRISGLRRRVRGFQAQARIVSSRNCALAPIATAPALGGLNAPQGYQMQRNLSERLWVCHDR
jgi:hypothetical protein